MYMSDCDYIVDICDCQHRYNNLIGKVPHSCTFCGNRCIYKTGDISYNYPDARDDIDVIIVKIHAGGRDKKDFYATIFDEILTIVKNNKIPINFGINNLSLFEYITHHDKDNIRCRYIGD